MKQIKIYLQYPWKFPDSPYYKCLLQEHPKEIKYLNAEKQKGVITNKRFFWLSNFLKRNIRRTFNLFKFSIPNAHNSKNGDYDLIHCAHCLSKNKNKSWICDIESEWQFYIGNKNRFVKKRVEKILKSEDCKKILPWTQNTANEIIKEYPSIKEKIEIVYPAMPVVKDLKKPKNKRIKIIFVARYFDIKCGLIALETLEKLREKYDIEGIVISNVPKNLKKQYSKLKIYNLMPHKEVCKLLESSDLFLYPSAIDTFGFSLLEAMAYGLPTITINTGLTKSRKEIIENNKTGLIFDVNEKLSFDKIGNNEKRVIEKLVENSGRLIVDEKLRNKMSKECIKVIKDEKFSINERNKKMNKIYEEILG